MRPEISFIINTLIEFISNEKSNNVIWYNVNDFDRELIIKLARKHKVLILLQAVANRHSVEQLGTHIVQKSLNRLHHKIRLHACTPLFKLLNENGIRYCVLKGAYLSQLAYGDIGWRSSDDVDLFISRSDITKVIQICKETGFIQGLWDSSLKQVKTLKREQLLFYSINTHQLAPFVKPTGYAQLPYMALDINFNLKWGEDDKQRLDATEFINKYIVVECAGIEFPVFNKEMFLIQLCLHLYKEANSIYLLSRNNGICLRHFCDIYYYIIRNEHLISITDFISLIKEHQLEKYIYYSLSYTQQIFGSSPWIKKVMTAIQPEDLSFLHQFGLDEDEIKELDVNLEDFLFNENFFNSIQTVLTLKDWEKINLNRKYL